jgi:hypothetical protein
MTPYERKLATFGIIFPIVLIITLVTILKVFG